MVHFVGEGEGGAWEQDYVILGAQRLVYANANSDHVVG